MQRSDPNQMKELAVGVFMSRVGRHAAKVKLDGMTMAVQRVVIGEAVKMNAQRLYHEEREDHAQQQRNA